MRVRYKDNTNGQAKMDREMPTRPQPLRAMGNQGNMEIRDLHVEIK